MATIDQPGLGSIPGPGLGQMPTSPGGGAGRH